MSVAAIPRLDIALPSTVAHVQAGRLPAFAYDIGERDPVYQDQGAAGVADRAWVPVPPTCLTPGDAGQRPPARQVTAGDGRAEGRGWALATCITVCRPA